MRAQLKGIVALNEQDEVFRTQAGLQEAAWGNSNGSEYLLHSDVAEAEIVSVRRTEGHGVWDLFSPSESR